MKDWKLIDFNLKDFVPQAHSHTEGKHTVFRVEQDEVAITRSAEGGEPERHDLQAELHLNPQCQYSISVRANLKVLLR